MRYVTFKKIPDHTKLNSPRKPKHFPRQLFAESARAFEKKIFFARINEVGEFRPASRE
jgi:hypothetical protein